MYCIIDEDLLSPDNIKEVLDEIWDYRARWKSIGIELRVDTGTLDAIEANNRKVGGCLQEMIKHWLRNSPRPTRETIRVALRSKLVSNAAGNYMQASYLYFTIESMMMLSSLCGMHGAVC